MSAVIDIEASFRAAIRAEGLSVDQLRPLIKRVVAEALDERANDRLLDSTATAKFFSKPSTKAFSIWLTRKGGKAVAALAIVGPDGKRRWRQSDLETLFVSKGGKK